MPKLLIVTTVPATLRAFLLPFAQHFRAQGWQVDAMAQFSTEIPEITAAFDQLWHITWSRNPLDPRNLLSAVPRIQQIAQQQSYDLIHVHTPVAAFVTRFALKNLRRNRQRHNRQHPLATRVIYTAHGFHFHPQGSPLKNAIYQNLERWAGAWTDQLITINHTDYQAAEALQLLPRDRLCYMPGIGVDLRQYDPTRVSPESIHALRTELGVGNRPLLLCIAELIPRKRHADLLQAFAQVRDRDAHLLLAGEGPQQPAMQALAQQLGLGDRVHFLGLRRDIPRLICAARATILVSQQEGLPRSVMESLALATPVIGSNIRGTADLLANGGGQLVAVGDIPALATAIQQMLDQPEQATAMGQQGRSQMQTYALPQIIQRHQQLYQQVLGLPEVIDQSALSAIAI